MTADRNGLEHGIGKVRAPMALSANLGDFLFAEVVIEPSGLPLTTLSALARLGLEPWNEAGRLAKLPLHAAAGALSRSLAALPGEPLSDLTGTAARLVALLPGSGVTPLPPCPSCNSTTLGAAQRRAAVLALTAVLTGLALFLVGHLAAEREGGAAAVPPSSFATARP